jgi:hypothetical protein
MFQGIAMSETLEEFFDHWQFGLRDLNQRLLLLERFVAELDRVRRGKPYFPWNDVIWQQMVDTNAMLVIDFASWVNGVCQRGGLLGTLKARYAKAFSKKRPWDSQLERGGDSYIASVHDRGHAEAFARVFPDATDQAGSGFEGLQSRLNSEMEAVLLERDQVRAHRYEKGEKTATPLEVHELREKLDGAMELMADLRGMAVGNTLAIDGESTFASIEETARELVFSFLLGTNPRRRMALRGLAPEEYFELRHRLHEARSDRDNVAFNDVWPDDPLDDTAIGYAVTSWAGDEEPVTRTVAVYLNAEKAEEHARLAQRRMDEIRARHSSDWYSAMKRSRAGDRDAVNRWDTGWHEYPDEYLISCDYSVERVPLPNEVP